jgi:protein-S-isoprenylcysteine O-methyltransferase Ste14
VYIVWWLAGAVRRKEKHEVTTAVGTWLFITLCFESFGNLAGLVYWFVEPSVLTNLAGIVSLVGSGLIFLVASQTMRLRGKPEKGWEQTTQLVETGIFSMIRHPIYLSSLLAMLGVFLLKISLISVIATPIGGMLFFLSARFEDEYDEKKFGQKYIEYRKKTKWFIPYIY